MDRTDQSFKLVGRKESAPEQAVPKKRRLPSDFPLLSCILVGVILLGCLFCGVLSPKDPGTLNLAHLSQPPCGEFLFGTDPLGRDVFSMIWYGGRISLCIGFLSTALSTCIAVLYGCICGVVPAWLDDALMRFSEMAMSIPSILIIIFLQAILGQANILSISLVIGFTSWMSIAKVVRTEVHQIKSSEYIQYARLAGGRFFYILRRHLLPNFIPSIMFMVVTNISSAIGTESTLSFLGLGLPVETVSWGSMLSMADRALLSNNWWLIIIPGLFLVTTLVCITNIGHYIRNANHRRCSNL